MQETRPLWVKKLLNISEGSVATCLRSGGIIGEFTAVSHGVWILKVSHHQKSLGKVTPGWAGARRQLLDFMVQWEINRGRHTDHPAGRHAIQTNQCPPPPLPHIFYGPDALRAAQPAVSKHLRQLKIEQCTEMLLHCVWVVDDTKCISITRVCLSVATCPHYCTDPDVTWGVVGLARSCALLGGSCNRCTGFAATTTQCEREMSASACTRSMPGSR